MVGKYFITLYLFLFLFLFKDTGAQDIPHFLEKLTTEEGLSSNKINDIVQDEAGFLWIATSDGLDRYDGTEVIQYFHKSSSNSVSHNYIHRLVKLPGNKIAIGTQKGVSFYNSNTGSFRNYYYKLNNALDEYNNMINQLVLGKKGNLWAASKNCIFIFDSTLAIKKIIASDFKADDTKRARLDFVRNIFPLSNGDVLLQLYSGWQIFSSGTKQLTSIHEAAFKKQFSFLDEIAVSPTIKRNEDIFSGSNIFSVYDHYFICFRPGVDSLFLFDEQGEVISSCYFAYNKYPYVLWSQSIVQLDKNKLLFLFHNYGLAAISVSWHGSRPAINEISPLLFDNYEFDKAICDRQGNWWLATSKDGLQKVSPYKQFFNGTILTSKKTGKQIKYEVNCTCRYGDKLWIGTYGDGFFETDPLMKQQRQHCLTNNNDDTWANFIWNIRQVNDDTLWIGTQVGLYWYSIKSQKNGRIKDYPGKPSALDSVPITTQFKDSRGLIWMGMGRSKGLCCFDSRNNYFKYYEAKNEHGYPLRYPLDIAENKQGNLWFTNDASPDLIYWNRNTDRFQTVVLPLANGRKPATCMEFVMRMILLYG